MIGEVDEVAVSGILGAGTTLEEWMVDQRLERIPKVLELYLQISQYPILGRLIRERMRREREGRVV